VSSEPPRPVQQPLEVGEAVVDGQSPERDGARPASDAAKRALDIGVASAAIVIAGPAIALMACLVKWTSPGPAFFRQERLGRGEQPFTLLKLRTMRVNNNDRIHREYVTSLLTEDGSPTAQQGGLYKLDNDPRITRLGAWLRRTSLDELPQLFNVLSGQMSLVGPRPVLPWEAELFHESDRERFTVKPGITGLWQVSGRNKLSFREALALDVEYARCRTISLDLLILMRTVPTVLRGAR
jgi:lipopolysaccharide/colanic/teichoic acid biosynthesis glycosyltransferase